MKKTVKTLIVIVILIIAVIILSQTESGHERTGKGAIHPATAPKR